MKKLLNFIFNIVFINYHYSKKVEIDKAKKIGIERTGYLVGFVVLGFTIFGTILVLSFFNIYIKSRPVLYATGIILYIIHLVTRKIYFNFIIKSIDFKIDNYTARVIKSNNYKLAILLSILGLLFGSFYVILRLS